jgi:hypothetical protein
MIEDVRVGAVAALRGVGSFLGEAAAAGWVFVIGVGMMIAPLAAGQAPLGWMGMWWGLVALYVAALDLKDSAPCGLSWRVVVSSVAAACAWPLVVVPWRDWLSPSPGKHAQVLS